MAEIKVGLAIFSKGTYRNANKMLTAIATKMSKYNQALL
jgi:hypothetical protein